MHTGQKYASSVETRFWGGMQWAEAVNVADSTVCNSSNGSPAKREAVKSGFVEGGSSVVLSSQLHRIRCVFFLKCT